MKNSCVTNFRDITNASRGKLLTYFTIATLISGMIGKLQVNSILLFFIYQAFFVYLPGVSFVFLIKRFEELDYVDLIVGYIMGYCLSIVQYFICMLVGKDYVTCRIILGLIFLIPLIVKSVKFSSENNDIFDVKEQIFSFSIVVFVLCLLLFEAWNVRHKFTSTTVAFDHDYALYLSIVASAKNGFPIETVWASSNQLFYHYFSALSVADATIMTGLPVTDYVTSLSYLPNILLQIFSTFLIVGYFIKEKKTRTLASFLILFYGCFERFAIVTVISHYYSNPFGYNVGWALSLFCAFLFAQILKDNELKWKILLLVAWPMACGAKGPTALIALAGILLCFVYKFLFEKYHKNFLLVVYVSIVFFIIYHFIINDPNSSGNDPLHSFEFYPSWILHNWFSGKVYALFHQSLHIPSFFAALICFSTYIVFAVPLIGFILYALIKRWKNFDDADILLLGASIAGIVLTVLFFQRGYSQMYFIMTASAFLMLFLCRDAKIAVLHEKCHKAIVIINITAFIFSLLVSPWYLGKYAVPYVKQYILKNYQPISITTANAFNVNLHEALDKLRLISTPNDVWISNYCGELAKRSYIIGAFSERVGYLEAYDSVDDDKVNYEKRISDVNKFLNDDNSVLSEFKEHNINYYIEFTALMGKKSNLNLKKILANDDIVLYQIVY